MNDVVLHPGNFLSMCSGYGGLDLGLHIADPAARCVCYVEREASAAATLVARMEDAALDRAPIWSDVTTFDSRAWRGKLGGLAAGYPCQGESLAGLRKGTSDQRFIFPHIARTIFDARIPVVFCENVGAHLSGSFYAVARYMQEMGFTLAAGLFTAEEVGASHKRERLFWLGWNPGWVSDASIGRCCRPGERENQQPWRNEAICSDAGVGEAASHLSGPLPSGNEKEHSGHQNAGDSLVTELAHARRERPQISPSGEQPAKQQPMGNSREMEYAAGERQREARGSGSGPQEWATGAGPNLYIDGKPAFSPILDPIGDYASENLPLFAPGPSDHRAWINTLESAPILEPAVHRMAYGRSSRMDRLRLTGNGVFPLAAAYAYCTLRDALTEHFAAKRANEFTLMEAAE